MATIRSLNVSIKANTTGFRKGVKDARSSLQQFAGAVASTGKMVAGFAAGVATAAAVGLSVMVKNQMEAIDASSKLADQLGLSTEQLAGFQHAADLSGVSGEQLATAFRKMQVSISEAAAGTKMAQDTFHTLGVDWKALRAMQPGEQFETVADAISKLGNQTDRVRVAQELFGRSGMGLLSMLQGGKAGLADMQREAEKLGLTFSRTAGAQVELANDALTRLWATSKGLANQIAIQLSPFIQYAAEQLTAFAVSGDGVGPKVSAAMEAIAKSLGVVADMLHVVTAGWHAFMMSAHKASAAVLKAMAAIGDASGDKRAVKIGLFGPSEMSKETGAGMAKRWRRMAQMAESDAAKSEAEMNKSWGDWLNGTNSQKIGQLFTDIQNASKKAADAMADAAKPPAAAAEILMGHGKSGRRAIEAAIKRNKANATLFSSMRERATEIFQATRSPLESFKSHMSELGDLLKNQLLDWDTYKRAVEAASQSLKDQMGLEEAQQGQGFGALREVDLSRLDPRALSTRNSKPQKVEDPANKEAVQLLKEIKQKMGGGLVLS